MPGRLQQRVLLQAAQVDVLADGRDGEVAGQPVFGAGERDRAAPAAGVGFAQLHADAGQGLEPAVLRDQLGGRREQDQLHPLFDGGLDLHGMGRHLVARAPIQEGHLGGAQPLGGAGGVEGGIAAADHHDIAVDLGFLRALQLPEEIDARKDAGDGFFVGQAHAFRLLGAECQVDGVEALFLEAGDREVFSQGGIGFHGHAQVGDPGDLLVQQFLGQAVLGDAVAQHAAQVGRFLEQGDGVALQHQVIGAGQSRGPAADDGDFLAVGRRHGVGVQGSSMSMSVA